MSSTLPGLPDIRPDERRNAFAAFTTLLALTSGHTLLETARDALFLSKLPASQLPWMYLVIVVLALALSQVRRTDKKATIVAVLLAAAGVTTGFWALTDDVASTRWVLYALYAWSGLFASSVTVQFWTLLSSVHTVTQAKRVYGFIGAGAVLGGVVGALAARATLAFVPPREILLGSAVLFAVAAAPAMALRIPTAGPTGAARAEEPTSSLTTGGRLLWQSTFACTILGIIVVATVAVTLADFLFKARIAEAYPDPRVLAARLSTFYAVTNALALVAQLFVGPWIFRAAGVQRALFFFPTLLFGAAGAVLVTGRLGAAVLLKLLDGTLRHSVHRTSMELLFVPIPDGTRERIKPIVELVGTRGGQAIASFVILTLALLGAATTSALGALIVVLIVLWLAIVVSIRRHYLAVFRETLHEGGLSGKMELPELDLGALEMLFAGLNSSRDIEVLASLELLAEQHRERLIPALILYHPSRDVVLRALEIFKDRGQADFLPIADRLDAHPDREVAAAALRARIAVAPDRQLLEQRLAGSSPEVAAAALVALMARGWIDRAEADRRLGEAMRSSPTAIELARAIRDTFSTSVRRKGADLDPAAAEQFDDLLVRLAREAGSLRAGRSEDGPGDEDSGETSLAGDGELPVDVRVRLEVARAMAARPSPKFLPVLVGMLSRHELRAAARVALARIPGALEFIDEVLDNTELARDVRVHIPRTMVLFEPEAAARKLMVHLLTEKDGAVRFKVLRALVKLRRANPGLFLEADILRRGVEANLDHTEELRRWRFGLLRGGEEVPPTSAVGLDPLQAAHLLLVDLVRDKESHAIQRLFMLLGLLYGEDFEDIERGLRSKKPKTRASSLELVENIVRPPLRARVLALVGDEREPDAGPLSYEDTLREILTNGGSTMRTLAEYRAVEIGLDVDAITGTRGSRPAAIEAIGRRLVDRARDLVTPEPVLNGRGASRASA